MILDKKSSSTEVRWKFSPGERVPQTYWSFSVLWTPSNWGATAACGWRRRKINTHI